MSDPLNVLLDPEVMNNFSPSSINFPVVGMGASAGGLEALLRFFKRMPADNGMAFVVILHLSPTHESNVAEILQQTTPMTVMQVKEPTVIEADHIYVIPPNHDLTLNNGELRLSDPTRVNEKQVVIDLFFRSLAQVYQERAVAIVLSGTGTDGAAGLVRVKEQGGVTLAQTPEDAEYDGMPKAAIATGMVDFIEGAVDMPKRLLDRWANASRIRLPKDTGSSLNVAAAQNAETARLSEEALRDIMALLRRYSKNDFRQYKQATVLSRIQHRIQVNELPDLPAYCDYLRAHPEEAEPLLQDMLLSVTNFFRDCDAFDALERDVLPTLFENRLPDDPLQVWVAGCATGEEAYSVAMLLREQTALHHRTCEFQVFATDIDEKAIGLGRSGLYPSSITTNVSPSRLQRFFIKEQDRFRVVKQVREKVLFALHNVLQGSPFSRLDLVCCRNLLIYLDQAAQSRVLEMFRFALKPGGYLFLGTSESGDIASSLFTVVDKKNGVYKTNPHAHVLRHLPIAWDLPRERVAPVLKSQNRLESSPSSFGELHRMSIKLVMFQAVAEKPRSALLESTDTAQQWVTSQFENEIKQLKSNLPDTVEPAETSTEELNAANKKLQAIIEELCSASEEQKTSKEALQFINEELTTINFELKAKVDETSKINDDLQNFIASTDIATIFIDRSLRIKRYTPQAARIFSLIATDVNRSLLDITHKLDYESLARDVDEVLKAFNMIERQVSSSDGKQYLARVRACRTTDDRIDGAALTFVDVTALRRAEENLREGEERLRIAAETTKDYAILTVDEEGLITSWNLGARRIFGYEEKEIVGQSFLILFTPEDRAAGTADDELRCAREEGRCTDERWHIRKDGSTFFSSGVMTRLEGKMGGYAKIARDMTESKTLEASRDALLVMEKKANELKDQFLAVMSHELKHPLNLIQVNTELLISQPEVRALPAVVRAGETIRLAVASQTKIIDDLLDLSRARTGKLTLRLAPVDLNELTASIAAAALEAAGQKSLTLKYECNDEQVFTLCDRVRTEQVFWNLINNAIKFTPAGGRISVQLVREASFAKFTVADTGQGIAPEFLPQVFGLFVQEPHPSSSTNAGLGVGLTLVRDLTVAQGGKVLADSAGLNKGATFTVWLPLAKSRPQAKKSPVLAENLKELRILVVDDMIDLLEPFAALLRLEGADVDIATSGQQALELLETNSYDLLISDVGMPYMDGYELIRKIRKRPGLHGLKAIALSGYGRQVDAVRALQSGFDAHLAKPATVAHICQSIAQLVFKAQG